MLSENIYIEKAKESLASAEDDFKSRRYNCCARSSYYACFQVAIYALLKFGTIKPKNEKWRHEFVKGQFVLQFINRQKRFSGKFRDTLERCSVTRQVADYETRNISEKEAMYTLKLSRAFINEIIRGGG